MVLYLLTKVLDDGRLSEQFNVRIKTRLVYYVQSQIVGVYKVGFCFNFQINVLAPAHIFLILILITIVIILFRIFIEKFQF